MSMAPPTLAESLFSKMVVIALYIMLTPFPASKQVIE